MARITIEDCLKNKQIINRFELVILAAERAKDINSGATITINNHHDKSPIIALREFSQGKIDVKTIRAKLEKKILGGRSTYEDSSTDNSAYEQAVEEVPILNNEDMDFYTFYEEENAESPIDKEILE